VKGVGCRVEGVGEVITYPHPRRHVRHVHRLVPLRVHGPAEREFFIDNLLVRIHFIIVMIRWTGLAPEAYPHPAWRERHVHRLVPLRVQGPA